VVIGSVLLPLGIGRATGRWWFAARRELRCPVQQRSVMMTALLVIASSSARLLFPSRSSLRAICTGALIHDRVFLTAGHCIEPGVSGIPPFVQVAVSFDPANAFDRASWVSVTRLLIHPSLPEACLSAPGCNPTTTASFPPAIPYARMWGLPSSPDRFATSGRPFSRRGWTGSFRQGALPKSADQVPEVRRASGIARRRSIPARFLQVAENDRRGVGLGLYISKAIVQGHGGRIWAESQIGQGSTFCFTLPIHVAH
jgi:hypothetical protein